MYCISSAGRTGSLRVQHKQSQQLCKLMDDLSHPDIFDTTTSEFAQYMEPMNRKLLKTRSTSAYMYPT